MNETIFALQSTIKGIGRRVLSGPANLLLSASCRYEFGRQLVRKQPWLIEERRFDQQIQDCFNAQPELTPYNSSWSAFHGIGDNRPASKFLFVVGSGSSGTTIALRILSEHPDIYTIPGETALFGEKEDHFVLEKLFSWEEQAKNENKSVILEKTPDHIFFVNRINAFLPKCKFICMMRDSRDTVASLIRRGWTFDKAVDEIIYYMKHLDILREKCANHILVRLEDLTANPQETISNILAFAGLRSSLDILDNLLNYHKKPKTFYTSKIEKPKNNIGRNTGRMRDYQINQPLKNDCLRWVTEIPTEKHVELHDRLGEWLYKYGYLESDIDIPDTNSREVAASGVAYYRFSNKTPGRLLLNSSIDAKETGIGNVRESIHQSTGEG